MTWPGGAQAEGRMLSIGGMRHAPQGCVSKGLVEIHREPACGIGILLDVLLLIPQPRLHRLFHSPAFLFHLLFCRIFPLLFCFILAF